MAGVSHLKISHPSLFEVFQKSNLAQKSSMRKHKKWASYETKGEQNQQNRSKTTYQKKQPRTISKVIPPFTKSMLSNTGSLNVAFIQCAKSVLKKFPHEVRSQITVSRTFTQIRDKTLHLLTITSPTVRALYHSIRSRGLNLLGQTVFPMGKHILNKERNFYTRR